MVPARCPIQRWLRRRSIEPTLALLERLQPASGGFLEATPLTSFVVMGLAGAGRANPLGMLRATALLLEWLGEAASAAALQQALDEAIAASPEARALELPSPEAAARLLEEIAARMGIGRTAF